VVLIGQSGLSSFDLIYKSKEVYQRLSVEAA
jgi:hypothetical protein